MDTRRKKECNLVIELKNVSKVYKNAEETAVKGVSVHIKKGEFFVLVGPSGCGKSTLLRMIAGLEEISSGDLIINERVANDLEPKDRNLSMVFQNYALYPHLSVEENILFGLKVRKVQKEERQKRLMEAIEMVGLKEYVKMKPGQLSGGQRQRVALARAIVSQAPICLMDEPLSNLDAKLRAQMRIEIREIQQRLGITMIYVTHDQIEAMTMGDRIMVLNKGSIQQVGTPLDIYNEPANEFVASFIGSPSMNINDGEVNKEKGVLHIGQLQIPLSIRQLKQLPEGTIRIGMRPEHIALSEEGQEVTLQSVEVLGNESILNFAVNGTTWSAKVIGQLLLNKGDKVKLLFSQEKLCFFNENTNERLKVVAEEELKVVAK
ncbi:sn-glycerol-3-phosphate ABC transporter ATP-binding protein UgpC [Bacillus cereus]|jgi:sn-glycerol 3-phosphate transport system ATP-binding protein|uniref:Sn-glycerol-3-phosphate ABC transporter ATP-binding protein UgpC n=3 Tax=Bacillus cereus group TaxID=86661 RepID=A0A9X6T0E0_BACCE|nr:sn-glycerol-3-phosphate ABC transporter ATP-binding protein UgpC [Bacillus cereus]AKJ58808.1 glycerol-3-phosphate ABC transporter ATP-binding protein [Bacillus thuringiensis]OTW73713.1 glycerol-3-phosphate ABC transporter ATP-binding protein [Bacillus thuringiensis serovar amagiensis]OTW80384.1 glycerol-3-phosphate ABC transporter ATP-binding protein [Bacillus thuringiensis serovar jinghongiensis]OTX24905.1 glycerol-3-phosphate ABC transporter ATP-binding protein [Bacillus thuringiensis sero